LSEAVIIALPIVPIVRFDPAGREQRDRERAQAYANRLMPPPRTMPLLVIDNARERKQFDQCMLRLNEALNAGDNLA
jgi:hypothetical protein